MSRIDPIKEAINMSLYELSRATGDRTWWTSLIIGSPGADSTACNTYMFKFTIISVKNQEETEFTQERKFSEGVTSSVWEQNLY